MRNIDAESGVRFSECSPFSHHSHPNPNSNPNLDKMIWVRHSGVLLL